MPDNKCDICGKYELLPFKCRYCGGTFCSAHRLPENHNCAGLHTLKQRSYGEHAGKYGAAKKKSAIRLPVLKLPYSGYWAYIIIGITVVVFILQLLLGSWFTNFFYLSYATLLTRPWGLVTNIFLHSGFMHIFFNMLALFFFGPLLERQIGSKSFLGLYIGSGIIAGLIQVLLIPAYPVIGASGAIYGVLGALTMIMPDLVIFLYFVPVKIVYAVILFAILDLFPILTGSGSDIAHAAHLTGLAVGLAVGYWYRRRNRVRSIRWQI